MPGRDSVLVVLVVLAFAALPACSAEGAEDATIAAPGPSATILIGAVGAVGVSFDPVPAPLDTAPSPHRVKPRTGPRPLPVPVDPFADPPEPSSDAGAVHHHAPGGTAL